MIEPICLEDEDEGGTLLNEGGGGEVVVREEVEGKESLGGVGGGAGTGGE